MRSKSSSMPAGVGRLKSLPEKETFDLTDIAGALMIFCGGLVMALEDHMPTAAESLAQAVGHSNIMAICCFGEQGMITQKKAVHGNLMFRSLVISKRPRQVPARARVSRPSQVFYGSGPMFSGLGPN